MPTFAGGAQELPNLYDMFTSLIVNEDALSNVHKFYYLKKSLKGIYLSLIKNVAVTTKIVHRRGKLSQIITRLRLYLLTRFCYDC